MAPKAVKVSRGYVTVFDVTVSHVINILVATYPTTVKVS